METRVGEGMYKIPLTEIFGQLAKLFTLQSTPYCLVTVEEGKWGFVYIENPGLLWQMSLSLHSRQGLLVTVNGNPVDYHTIHPSLPMENGPGKADLYSTPQYRWEPSDESSGRIQPCGHVLYSGSHFSLI